MFNLEGELPSLFPSTVQKCDRIQGEYPETLYEFRPQDIDAKFLSTLENRTLSIGRRLLTRTSNAHEQTKWKRLASAKFTWSCIDEDSQAHNGTGSIDWELRNKMLLVSEDGFMALPMEPLCGAAAPPGPTCCAIMDVDQHKTRKEYPISRVIEAGGWERFQILIGATKSCRAIVRVGFYSDKEELVHSNPRMSRLLITDETNTTLGTATAKKFWRNPPKRWKTITVLLRFRPSYAGKRTRSSRITLAEGALPVSTIHGKSNDCIATSMKAVRQP